MDSPSNLQSILHEILQSQQNCLHTMSACADELSSLSTNLTNIFTPPSLTPSAITHTDTSFPQIFVHHQQPTSQISFHHQPGVINFTHLCSPSPHNHYQDPNPPIYNPQPTTTRSFIKQSPISNPTYLEHHGYYHEPIHRPELLLTNSTPLFSAPSVKREEEVKFQASITGSKFSTIADEENFSVIANFSTPEMDEPTQKLVTAEAKNHEAEPAMIQQFDLPSGDSNHMASLSIKIFGDSGIAKMSSPLRMVPAKCYSATITRPSPPPQVDTVPTVTVSGSKLCFDFIFRTPDLMRPTRFELEKFFFATAVSPTKTKGNAIFVFDPGGISPCYAFSSATAPPPPRSTFVFDPGGYRHCLGLIVPFLICVTVRLTHLQQLLSAALPLAQRIRVRSSPSDLVGALQVTYQMGSPSSVLGPNPFPIKKWPCTQQLDFIKSSAPLGFRKKKKKDMLPWAIGQLCFASLTPSWATR